MKIIALTLDDNNSQETPCYKSVKKVLTQGTYKFYDNYEIGDDDNLVIKNEEHPFSDKFDTPWAKRSTVPTINVCAIVGKNGSGKSSLIELIIRLINNFACSIIGDETVYNGAKPLHFIPDIYASLYYEKGGAFFCLSQKGNTICLYKNQRSNLIYSNQYDNNEWDTPANQVLKDSALKDFFYTVVVNYALYAYNLYDFKNEWDTIDKMIGKLHIGKKQYKELKQQGEDPITDEELCWLSGLFHKNDGYQTPIVLNPFRDNGIIDVNNEKLLAKERLLSIILANDSQSFLKDAIKDKTISSLDISIDSAHSSLNNVPYHTEKLNRYRDSFKTNTIFEELCTCIIDAWSDVCGFRLNKSTANYKDEALNYVVYKTLRIMWQYKAYATDLFRLLQGEDKPSYICIIIKEKMALDQSHITLKLRQTIKYLQYAHIAIGKKIKFTDLRQTIEAARDSDAQSFAKSSLSSERYSNIEYLPAPIFNVRINLLSDSKKELLDFDTLSSGEKQMLYTACSILYHLNNIASVSKRTHSNDISYDYINIILEEIELYFHPEMQRRLVNYLIKQIRSLNLSIKEIQIVFATHSPFILSDIPVNNILYLDNGQPTSKKKETFGANIAELLQDSFFLNESYMGEFAFDTIKQLFKKKLKPKDDMYIRYIGDIFLQEELKRKSYDKDTN